MRTWNELSMAEKADVMKLAVEGGVYDLDSIRSGYNEYANGGKIHIKPSHRGRLTELKERTGKSEAELYNDGNPAHKKMVVFARNARKWKHEDGGNLYGGGGITGLITSPILPDIKEVRRRLYNGVTPAGYKHIPERMWDAMNGKQAHKDAFRDDQWATYLQIPENERHSFFGRKKLEPATFKPTKGNVGENVYKLPLDTEDTQKVIDEATLSLNPGENKVSRALDHYLGDHTVGRGYDTRRGDYVSYYDKYDLNPYAGGTSIKTGIKGLDKWIRKATANTDLSLGIGKPFDIYDRIYLDDYYGVPDNARGGYYLPEIEVIRKKKGYGGKIDPLFLSPLKLP